MATRPLSMPGMIGADSGGSWATTIVDAWGTGVVEGGPCPFVVAVENVHTDPGACAERSEAANDPSCLPPAARPPGNGPPAVIREVGS